MAKQRKHYERIMSVSDVSINADELEPLLSKLYEASEPLTRIKLVVFLESCL